MASFLESHHSHAVPAASNGIPGPSPTDAWTYDLDVTDVYGDLQRPSALSLSVGSDADGSHRTYNSSATGVTAPASSAGSPRPHQTPICATPNVPVTSGSKEQSSSTVSAAALDEDQRRCMNVAYHISFRGDPRVKLKPTAVALPNGVHFLIIDRFLSGNSDGVYSKSKKIWEHIPVGQARVFARAPTEVSSFLSSGRVEEAGYVKHKGSCTDIATTAALQCSPTTASSTKSTVSSPPGSPPIASSPIPNAPRSSSPLNRWDYAPPQPPPFCNEWTRVGTSVGLRKIGHWREATNVFSIHKEVSKRAVALEKVDGEPGRIAAFCWLGERYWIIGCRCQHIVTRLSVPEADLLRYGVSASSPGPASSSSSSAAASDDACVSSKLSFTERTSSSPCASSSTRNTHDDVEKGSVHMTATSNISAMNGGSASSEAAYLDLTVRIARLWRRLLESLCINTDIEATVPDAVSASNSTADTSKDPLVELHASVAADSRSLCFDVILSGWERLQRYSAPRDLPAEGPMSTDSPTAVMAAAPGVTGHSDAAASANTAGKATIPLWFYAITWDASLDECGWCMDVKAAFTFFSRFRLPTVACLGDVRLGSPDYEALRQSLLSRCDTAGAVLYGSNRDKADGGEEAAVVQVWKCRAYPHSLERVVQEYVVTHRLSGEPLRSKVKKKISSLSRETRLSIKKWELRRLPFMLDFALWLHQEKYITHSTDLVTLKAIRGHWLTHQERFQALEEARGKCSRCSGCTDAADGMRCPGKAESDDDAGNVEDNAQQLNHVEDASPPGVESLDTIMLIGPQGCGKSTLARILYALLEEVGRAPRWLNQDEAGSRSAYLASIRRAVSQGGYSHLLLDKMNLDDRSRSDYTAVGLKPVLVVAWTHPNGVEAMVGVCYNRVVQRGACHRSFCAEDTAPLGHPPSSTPSLSPVQQGGGDSPLSVSGGTPVVRSAPVSPSPLSIGQDECLPNVSLPVVRASPPSRLHGILQASAKRYQIPVNAPLVELDVTWSSQKMVAVVWEALREKGTSALPPLAELEVEAAMKVSYTYEQLLGTYPSCVESAVLRGPSSDVLIKQLSLVLPRLMIPKAQRVQPNVESLLHNFSLNPSPTAFVRYARQVGRARPMTVQAVVSNPKVTFLLMVGPTEAAAVLSLQRDAARSVLPTVPPGPTPSGEAAPVIRKGTTGGCAPPAAGDTSSMETSLKQEHFAVLARANVTPEYCEALARRVREDPYDDPYCTVQWLSTPLEVDFTVTLRFP
ncbi:hypothetical protein JKF63_04794 [Porcisia hertigi]|uniref:DUF7920 domain-containing protein n=1 Tax=Porcisia hertigi TaxID=2761500 RepID=A0A836IHD4_9TRYP|nr:hypothetical protein JKF63_04794 [Porcisia hertigi]